MSQGCPGHPQHPRYPVLLEGHSHQLVTLNPTLQENANRSLFLYHREIQCTATLYMIGSSCRPTYPV
jgi:hypothetical protein